MSHPPPDDDPELLSRRHSIDELAQASGWTGGIRQGRDWADVERKLGVSLPDDYKAMLSRFPSGFFRNAVSFENPIDARVDLEEFARDCVGRVVATLSDERLEYLCDTGYAPFPEPAGLLPWGGDLQGGMFCWLTEPADPNQWPIAYYSADLREWFEYDGGVVEMIREVLARPGGDNLLRRDLDHEEPVFRIPSTYAGESRGWIPDAEYR
ncbi:SMI1/KNR4 family protein [Amycolatopsis sp. NPDC003676]